MSTFTRSGIKLPPNPAKFPRSKRSGRRSPTMGLGALFDADGGLLWQEDDWTLNALADEGERDMNAVYLAGTTNPSKYLALVDGTTTAPTDTSTMAYLGGSAGARETQVPGANGYARQQILTSDWTDDGLVSGDNRFTAAEKTFGPASAAWTFNYVALVTAATGQTAGSGKFILYLPMSATTSVAINQQFKYILRQTLS